ncbi:MAG: hypothetical protein AB7E32_14065 [Desulfovibrio sp.]
MTNEAVKLARRRLIAEVVSRLVAEGVKEIPVANVWRMFRKIASAETDIVCVGPFSQVVHAYGMRLARQEFEGKVVSMLLMDTPGVREFLNAEKIQAKRESSQGAETWTPVHAPTRTPEHRPEAIADAERTIAEVGGRIETGRQRGCRVWPADRAVGEDADTLSDVHLRPVTLDTGAALHALGAGWERIYNWAGSDETLVMLEMNEALQRLRCGAEQDGDRLTVLAGGIVIGQRAAGGAA